ncbi:MAG: hypothetical protein AAF563_22020 [Pseudomonadota bacterium]
MSKILPVPIARYALSSVINGFDTVLRLGWLPALISSIAAMILESSIFVASPDTGELQVGFGPLLVFIVIAALTQTMFAVAWHRHVGLGESFAGRRYYFRLGRRELVYALIAFIILSVLSLGMGGLFTVYSLIAQGGGFGGIVILLVPVVAIAVIARLCLLLPMVAFDEAADPTRSWQGVSDNTVRVVAVLVLIGIPVVVIELLLISVFGSVAASGTAALGAPGLAIDLIARFVSSLVFLALLAVIAGAVTLLYMVLIGDEVTQSNLPAPPETFVE